MNVKSFMLAGNAIFTIQNPNTGTRFTYRVRAKEVEEGKTLHFVSILTGPDNTSSYSFLGTIFEGKNYRHGRNSRISDQAQSAKAFDWFFRRIIANRKIAPAVVHHECRCGRCGRLLTVPESVESGFGPECSARIAKAS